MRQVRITSRTRIQRWSCPNAFALLPEFNLVEIEDDQESVGVVDLARIQPRLWAVPATCLCTHTPDTPLNRSRDERWREGAFDKFRPGEGNAIYETRLSDVIAGLGCWRMRSR